MRLLLLDERLPAEKPMEQKRPEEKAERDPLPLLADARAGRRGTVRDPRRADPGVDCDPDLDSGSRRPDRLLGVVRKAHGDTLRHRVENVGGRGGDLSPYPRAEQ